MAVTRAIKIIWKEKASGTFVSFRSDVACLSGLASRIVKTPASLGMSTTADKLSERKVVLQCTAQEFDRNGA